MTINLNLIGTYATGQFDEGAAEIPAFDPSTNRLFVVNAEAVTVDVLDLSNPNNPVKIGEIDASALGGVANSVAVKNGIVAIAIEANIKTDNGSVAFFNSDSDFSNPVNPVNTVTVGALPDMVTFTPDGMKVLTANEGEANDDYSVDPEGSISIIDISTGVENASVTNANFNAFDSQKDALVAQGVRIFGLNASVSQDLEPEYIAFSADSQTAYVTLQENNALAVVDVTTGTVSGIVPLGFKNYNASPNLETAFFEESELPIIGTSQTRGDIRLGGFSGLTFLGMNDSGNYEFLTHMDLGPSETGNRDINDDGVEERVRTYLIPDLQPRLVKFEYNPNNGDTNILDQVLLTRQDGSPLTGLPNLPTDDGGRIPIDEDGNILDFDPLGADLEGLIQAPDGTFWAADEYRPALYKFSAEGVLIDRFVPEGLPAEVGTGVFPEAYNTRQANRGFEAIAFQDGKVYAFVQSPFNNPDSGETATTRILEFDPVAEIVTGEYLYIQEDIGGGSDKIGDAVATNKNGEFLVIERDSSLEADSQKVIFRINLNDATNLQTLPDDILEGNETFDSLTPEELTQKGINPVTKEVAINLTEIGYDFTDKPEGLTVIDETTIAVINDNDFDEAGIPIGLGIISLNNALDASNRDDSINIRNWPVFGMYQPDAIASYEVDGQTYLVTANEGDARIRPDGDLEDDQGNVIIEEGEIFNEENRINDIILDPVAFPNARQLQENDQLGRLNITNTLGVSDRAIFVAELTPDQEVPPAMSDAEGESFAFVDDNGFLNVELQVKGVDFGAVTGNPLTPDTGDDVILLHIHEAMRGMNGGVVWDLLADPDTEILIDNEGNATLTSIWQESDIPKTPQGEDTNYYFNLHTERNPGGELRGQIQGEIAYEELYAYGSRSFSIWDSNGNLVFDSGDDFEQITASLIPNDFNSNNDENGSFDARSDDKGPEPEGVTVGEINGVPYAFVGLERVGGVMVYDISDPTDAKFVQYINNRDFSVDAQLEDGSPNPEAGDLGPEGLVFISAEDSPNGIPLLVVANEVSGTTSIYEIEVPTPEPFTLQLLHASDQEAGIPALQDAIGFSAVLNALDAQYENTLKLSSGDLFIAGPFFNASQDIYGRQGIADILIQNELGWDAAAVGNHEFDAGPGTFYSAIAPNADIQGTGIDPTTGFTGANFPYLSTNLDYSTDSSDLKDLVVPAGEAPESASLTESVVVDVNGEQIGVIGAVVPYLPQIANIGGITMLTDPNSRDIEENAQAIADSVQPFVDELVAQGINKIVLMTHLQQFEVEQALASKLRHVDILMGGGSHRVMANDDDTLRQDETQTPPELLQPYPQVFQDADGNDIYLINTAANYRYVGQLIVDFDAEGNIISVGDESGAFATDIAGVDRLYEDDITTFEQVKAVADPELVEIVDGVGDFINGKDGNIFGNTEVWLNGLRSSVRTEETNLGNLTADANLWYAEQYGLEIDISVKNGGGIRDQIGVSFIDGGTNELIQLPPQANPAVGKEEGDVSQLDIENSLRFDNKLSVADISAQGIKDLAEHLVAQWAEGATPGQFGQIGGFSFSFDPDNTPIEFTRNNDGDATGVATPGERIQNLVLNREDGTQEAIVVDGELVVDPSTTYKMVILDFLAGGGDGYPAFYFENVVRLDSLNPDSLPNNSDLPIAGEQDALAEYLAEFFPDGSQPFDQADTPIEEDTRIQNLNFREDTIIADPTDPLLDTTIYRFRTGEGTYIYVENEERQRILQGGFNFVEEGEAFRVALEDGENLEPIYRFRNNDLGGAYLYVGEAERQSIRQNFTNFIEEGLAFYTYGADAEQADDIFRFQTQPGGYIFVGDAERQSIVNSDFNFAQEGIAFEALA
ncbi:choice-of-anchor I domain-containing protein [Cyanobacterium aponinum]|uniref:CHRD domain-containing protein n=1 Tax=Cyanobacterium aponinum 0216 TaxID=2676140 RepID=A0A844GU87_9CHRO|nr:CHRD domain-containing protein [Cyanobacterium aponinum 0216]